MAQHGLRVHAVDLTPLHIAQAQRNIAARELQDRITVELGDYHDLSNLADASFDGIYTMETFVHADYPLKVLANFHRLLQPGGVLVMHEADYLTEAESLQEVLRLSHCQNTLPQGSYEDLLVQAGFGDVTVQDLHANVLPLWRLFGVWGAVPYKVVKALRLQHRFVNVMAGVEAYRNWETGRYISVRAVRPV